MVFPLRKENSINGLIMAILENNDTSLRYTVLDESQKGYTEILQRFLAVDRENDRTIHIPSSGKFPPGSSPVALAPPIKTHGISINDNGNGDIDREGDGGSSGPVKEIREVTITVPKVPSPPIVPPPLPQDIKLPPVGPGGGCEMYENCAPYKGGGGGSGGGAPSDSQIKDQIQDQPFALVDAPCDVVKKWLETAKFKPSQAQLDKLKSIVATSSSNSSVTPGGITVQRIASLQRIDDAYSPAVNMDYFPVTVNQLPIVNGVRLTPEQFLNHIRTNINNFVDTGYSEFTPYNNYGVDDRNLWNSSNPLGAVIKIDIKGPDNGSVMVTNYRSDKWTFSTIYEPKYKTHPVSGNRDFGFTQNANGSYTFYTRGIDRLTTIDATTVQNSEFLTFMMGGSPFSQADALWTSLQNKINSFVNSHQGSSVVAKQEIQRPDWQKVKDVINGKLPLSTLSKDCGK
ncbi:hypothetical protein HZQ67_05415 [Elizabethkingia anophelis]|nr:hypothetical protein FF18_07965 [Elizabethkingia anophelis]MCT3786801.1 hypothetical protein [Elizabethkingia anophelis]MDV3501010.1 hypothetical protein [Elizabethkingia anophelis]PKR33136.1 hypothetical protein CWH99_01400 [Elizabethkingia anophelis]PKR35341.1 hypothetical protein CWI00_11900 [Elizabethkingia anophelis]